MTQPTDAEVPFGRGDESLLQVRVAGSQQGKLHAVGDQLVELGQQQIQPFLRGQPADHADQQCVGVVRPGPCAAAARPC